MSRGGNVLTNSASAQTPLHPGILGKHVSPIPANAAPEAGFTDHIWSLEELVGLLEQKIVEAA